VEGGQLHEDLSSFLDHCNAQGMVVDFQTSTVAFGSRATPTEIYQSTKACKDCRTTSRVRGCMKKKKKEKKELAATVQKISAVHSYQWVHMSPAPPLPRFAELSVVVPDEQEDDILESLVREFGPASIGRITQAGEQLPFAVAAVMPPVSEAKGASAHSRLSICLPSELHQLTEAAGNSPSPSLGLRVSPDFVREHAAQCEMSPGARAILESWDEIEAMLNLG
jgi:hypothetical protein